MTVGQGETRRISCGSRGPDEQALHPGARSVESPAAHVGSLISKLSSSPRAPACPVVFWLPTGWTMAAGSRSGMFPT